MKIRIVPYDPEWVKMFDREAAKIHRILGDEIADIQHIGSTSVTGLAAKPIIDILLGVRDFSMADTVVVPAMKAAGYVYIDKWEDVLPLRRFFVRENLEGERIVHIHSVGIDNHKWWDRHIQFRDYLRTHSETKQAYETLKRELAQREWTDGSEYAGAKTEFIRKIEQQAREAMDGTNGN